MLKRPLNVGFSGGEKKRMEILQMAHAGADAVRAGRDRFRARHRRRAHRLGGRQHAALQGARDARHHPLPAAAELHRARQGARDGRRPIRKTGGKELALELEKTGYAEFKAKAARDARQADTTLGGAR